MDIGWRGTQHVHPAESVREAIGFLAFITTGGYLLASARYRLTPGGVENRFAWFTAAPDFALAYAAGALLLWLAGWLLSRKEHAETETSRDPTLPPPRSI